VTGKTCLVTGASSGIGKATAEALARLGAKVVLGCRDLDKGRRALDDIAAATGSTALHLLSLDLASLAAVRAFASEFSDRFVRLDVLIANAGVSTARRQLSHDGHELDFAVNHLGHFLLTDLLLPRLRHASPARVVVVSSAAHRRARLDFADLQSERGFSPVAAYARSKLANLLFVRALARRLDGSGVTANALHPGVIATELGRDFPLPLRLLARWFFRAPAEGARTSVFLASAPEVQRVSGRYFIACREARPDAAALDDAAAERLWVESERLCAAAAR